MIVNMTPHAIRIRIDASNDAVALSSDIVLQPCGTVARVSATSVADGDVDGIPSYHTVYGSVQDLPDPQPDTICVVSALVIATSPPDRSDLRGPLTDRTAIRDAAGLIFAVRGLQH